MTSHQFRFKKSRELLKFQNLKKPLNLKKNTIFLLVKKKQNLGEVGLRVKFPLAKSSLKSIT